MTRLVIFDRDGTLNITRPDYIRSAEQFEAVPGALEAVARLNHAGWSAVVATNQAGVGRGLFDVATLNAIHARLNSELAQRGGRLDAVFFCPHTPETGCDCRKPRGGLYRDIARRYGLAPQDIPAVGDSILDLLAAQEAGCEPHLILCGRALEQGPEGVKAWLAQVPGTRVHDSLDAFAQFLIARERDKDRAGRHPHHAP